MIQQAKFFIPWTFVIHTHEHFSLFYFGTASKVVRIPFICLVLGKNPRGGRLCDDHDRRLNVTGGQIRVDATINNILLIAC